jgi:hypothetical protein
MGLSKLFSGFFDLNRQEDASSNQEKIDKYLETLDIETQVANLKGPFLSEQQAIKHIDQYKDCLCSTYYNVNCLINRHILLLCDDVSLETRDNARVELGISPFDHMLGICVKKSCVDFDVLEIDRNILLNEQDRISIKMAIQRCPPTEMEIRNYLVQ